MATGGVEQIVPNFFSTGDFSDGGTAPMEPPGIHSMEHFMVCNYTFVVIYLQFLDFRNIIGQIRQK